MAAVDVADHPAKFSDDILAVLRRLVLAERLRLSAAGRLGHAGRPGPVDVLDPFAGVGRIHQLASPGRVNTVGVEIQPGWASLHPRTVCADSLQWMVLQLEAEPWGGGLRPHVVATSVVYGNRLSDHHNARDGSKRHSYAHNLRAAGEEVAPGSSVTLPWGPDYWRFHADAYRLIFELLAPGGLFLLNVSDFYRQKELVQATHWHRGAAMGAGFYLAGRDVGVPTPRLRGVGAPATAARAPHEVVLRFRCPEEEE